MPTIVELARDVDVAKAAWDRARQRLLDALRDEKRTGPILPRAAAPRTRQPVDGGPSVAKQVLQLVTQAGSSGITRADLVAKLGHEAAVHSALKKYSGQKRMASTDGRWALVPEAAPKAKAPPKGGLK